MLWCVVNCLPNCCVLSHTHIHTYTQPHTPLRVLGATLLLLCGNESIDYYYNKPEYYNCYHSITSYTHTKPSLPLLDILLWSWALFLVYSSYYYYYFLTDWLNNYLFLILVIKDADGIGANVKAPYHHGQ